MNRVGLKDYLLNHADDNDLLDCAKAWDAANEYGQFDTYSSVEEAAQANGWDAAQALSEARRVDQDADFFRFNGYGHLESVSKASLLATARDSVDNIIGLPPSSMPEPLKSQAESSSRDATMCPTWSSSAGRIRHSPSSIRSIGMPMDLAGSTPACPCWPVYSPGV